MSSNWAFGTKTPPAPALVAFRSSLSWASSRLSSLRAAEREGTGSGEALECRGDEPAQGPTAACSHLMRTLPATLQLTSGLFLMFLARYA